MAKKKNSQSEQAEVQSKAQGRQREQYTGAPIAEFLESYPHIAVLCMNPAWKSGSEEDRWHFVLPIEGQPVVVRTKMSGFIPKSDLRQTALTYLNDTDRALEDVVEEYPQFTDTRDAKIIPLVVMNGFRRES